MTEEELIAQHDAALWCQSFSGQQLRPCALDPRSIRIVDIAHALSMQCRFGGHCTRFYSVAHHSLLVAGIVGAAGLGPMVTLQALLHDMTEAVLIDVPRPAKCSSFLAGYRELDAKIAAVMFPRFSLPAQLREEVKMADEIMLATERKQLMLPTPYEWNLRFDPIDLEIIEEQPLQFKERFLNEFLRLITEIREAKL